MSIRDDDMDMLERKFEAFFLLYFPKVKDVAMKFLKSECEAEDIAQDIFVKLWSKPHLWNNDDMRPIDGYLFSTAYEESCKGFESGQTSADYCRKAVRELQRNLGANHDYGDDEYGMPKGQLEAIYRHGNVLLKLMEKG